MKIEFMPAYVAGTTVIRCAGDDGCGSFLMSGDTEVHMKWHEKIDRMGDLTEQMVTRLNHPNSRAPIMRRGTWSA